MLKAKFLYQLVGMLVNFIVCFVLQESLPVKMRTQPVKITVLRPWRIIVDYYKLCVGSAVTSLRWVVEIRAGND